MRTFDYFPCAAQSLLDEMGAEKDCTTLNPEGDLVVARPEAVYFYSVDGRGPCFVFEGPNLHDLTPDGYVNVTFPLEVMIYRHTIPFCKEDCAL